MRQKYIINRDGKSNNLKIREYAIIDKNLKKVESTLLQKDSFVFLCEENYDSKAILESISAGVKAMIATLRTTNIFPIEPYAIKIAESVISLYNSVEKNSVELFFDDVDLFSVSVE